jgi:hypothetical protein
VRVTKHTNNKQGDRFEIHQSVGIGLTGAACRCASKPYRPGNLEKNLTLNLDLQDGSALTLSTIGDRPRFLL